MMRPAKVYTPRLQTSASWQDSFERGQPEWFVKSKQPVLEINASVTGRFCSLLARDSFRLGRRTDGVWDIESLHSERPKTDCAAPGARQGEPLPLLKSR